MNKPLFDIQKAIFEEIKAKIPNNVSFVHEISELLGVSYDSAYRRIRGEKVISLEELYQLSQKYKISVDAYFEIKSGKIAFDQLTVDQDNTCVKDWLQKLYNDIELIISAPKRSMIYAAKDAPFFHFFHIPEIAAFKVFFWQKTLFQFTDYKQKKFSMDDYDDEIQSIGHKLLVASTKIPTTEIWNEDTFGIFLRQIEYYFVAGLFANENEVWLLCDKLEEWIRHIQLQAEHGVKFLYGQEPHGVEDSFRLYENEVVLSDNTILVEISGRKSAYLTYNVASLLMTQDQDFCDGIEKYMRGLISKSTLISSSAAKERHRFFNMLIRQVQQFRSRIGVN